MLPEQGQDFAAWSACAGDGTMKRPESRLKSSFFWNFGIPIHLFSVTSPTLFLPLHLRPWYFWHKIPGTFDENNSSKQQKFREFLHFLHTKFREFLRKKATSRCFTFCPYIFFAPTFCPHIWIHIYFAPTFCPHIWIHIYFAPTFCPHIWEFWIHLFS